MFKSVALLAFIIFTSSTIAAPANILNSLAKCGSGPSINVIFFSDSDCQTAVPATVYTRPVYGDNSCYFNSTESYSSLIVDHIDDHFIGTNSALEVGYSTGDSCDWTYGLKNSIATRHTVGQCQYVGIPTGTGKPTRAGNEYRLTTLQGWSLRNWDFKLLLDLRGGSSSFLSIYRFDVRLWIILLLIYPRPVRDNVPETCWWETDILQSDKLFLCTTLSYSFLLLLRSDYLAHSRPM